MIVRLMAIDPAPRVGSHTDVVVYQIPENSREYELLTTLFDKANIEWTVLKSKRKAKEIKLGKV